MVPPQRAPLRAGDPGSLRLGFDGVPSMQRRMLGRDGRQRTPAGAPGASQLPQCCDPDTPSQNFSASTTVQLNVQ